MDSQAASFASVAALGLLALWGRRGFRSGCHGCKCGRGSSAGSDAVRKATPVGEDGKPIRWIFPEQAQPETSTSSLFDDEASDVLSPEQVRQWKEQGYLVLDKLLPHDVLDAARKDMTRFFPNKSKEELDEMADLQAFDFGSEGLTEFPSRSTALNTVSLHPRLVKAAQQCLGIKDVRLTQSDAWPKYGLPVGMGANKFCNRSQRIHVDFPNHTLVVPPPWESPEVMSVIIYYDDVRDTDGGTAVVARRGEDDPAYEWPLSRTPGFGPVPWINDREMAEEYLRANHPDMAEFRATHLYPREQRVHFNPGTVLLYRHDIWHRGTPIRVGSTRRVHNLVYKRPGTDWLTTWNNGWCRSMYEPEMTLEKVVATSSVRQRSVLGFPPPGHSYWSRKTLDAVAARYESLGMDMTPYEEAFAARADMDL